MYRFTPKRVTAAKPYNALMQSDVTLAVVHIGIKVMYVSLCGATTILLAMAGELYYGANAKYSC